MVCRDVRVAGLAPPANAPRRSLEDGALVHELVGLLRLGAEVVRLCEDSVAEELVWREVEVELKARVGALEVLERNVGQVLQRLLVVLLHQLAVAGRRGGQAENGSGQRGEAVLQRGSRRIKPRLAGVQRRWQDAP